MQRPRRTTRALVSGKHLKQALPNGASVQLLHTKEGCGYESQEASPRLRLRRSLKTSIVSCTRTGAHWASQTVRSRKSSTYEEIRFRREPTASMYFTKSLPRIHR